MRGAEPWGHGGASIFCEKVRLKFLPEELCKVCPIYVLICAVFEGAIKPMCLSLFVDFNPSEPMRVTELASEDILQ